MLLSTTYTIPGKEIEVLGLVNGVGIQTTHLGKDLGALLKNVVGGELTSYTEILGQARDLAIERMEEEAKKKNADAIVGVKLTTSSMTEDAAEVLAYGTAVKYV